MSRIVLVGDDDATRSLIADLPHAGVEVLAVIAPDVLRHASSAHALPPLPLREADALLLPADRALLPAWLRADCDRAGVRILLLGQGERAERLARRNGLRAPLPPESSAWDLADAITTTAPVSASTAGATGAASAGTGTGTGTETSPDGVVLAVWGPPGAPGRTTVAIQLAAALASPHRQVSLVDADTHAPSIALLLGLADDGPGIAAACRRAEMGLLDGAELSRLATPVTAGSATIDVLAGLNRPSRWPELSAARLRATLVACRDWAPVTVVDVAASLEADEELMSDVAVPRRNAAALTVLETADRIIAVAAADPLGIARFVRAYAELRAVVGTTPVTVLVNRLRPGPVGLDARTQIRRTLERFSGILDIRFLPLDARAADAALLHGKPISEVSPRSALAAEIARLAASLDQGTAGGTRRGAGAGVGAGTSGRVRRSGGGTTRRERRLPRSAGP
ncbi:MinD-like ATPase involved in chromosome partitioning or flagellar assembly [Microbacterium resistens]|uniref:MinD-like ATPase involved in chromosome partitioning or flagellar assembly n=1 Tax=Microbacterium resistens TaxID=156977 RepID=A0ABU1S9T0_9MICO|nr:P-loop NTPase [Microbacterium resistens]MDR6866367.1 MinD-like ATPase involved in chromosome partitioning or flagellar assembly [Microbacterium resistens]